MKSAAASSRYVGVQRRAPRLMHQAANCILSSNTRVDSAAVWYKKGSVVQLRDDQGLVETGKGGRVRANTTEINYAKELEVFEAAGTKGGDVRWA